MSAPSTSAPELTRGHVDQFLATFEREQATTMRVLRAFPEDKADLRPAEKCKTALELAWLFAREQDMLEKALTTGFDWSSPPKGGPAMPGTMPEIVDALEAGYERVVRHLRESDPAALPRTVSFFTAPRTIGDIPTMTFLWFMLHDQIHHRGQFSIYLRMAGAKVPSIYGPSADEPWM